MKFLYLSRFLLFIRTWFNRSRFEWLTEYIKHCIWGYLPPLEMLSISLDFGDTYLFKRGSTKGFITWLEASLPFQIRILIWLHFELHSPYQIKTYNSTCLYSIMLLSKILLQSTNLLWNKLQYFSIWITLLTYLWCPYIRSTLNSKDLLSSDFCNIKHGLLYKSIPYNSPSADSKPCSKIFFESSKEWYNSSCATTSP